MVLDRVHGQGDVLIHTRDTTFWELGHHVKVELFADYRPIPKPLSAQLASVEAVLGGFDGHTRITRS
jgi:hypothetical protein